MSDFKLQAKLQKATFLIGLFGFGLLNPCLQARALEKIPFITPVVQQKHIIPKAVQFEFTAKGASYFERNLMGVLSNLGLNIDEAYLNNYEWHSDEAYDLNKLNLEPQTLKLISSVRGVLRNWFMGYEVNAVKPSIKLTNMGYQAVFNRFSITADPDKLKMLNKTNGAVLTLDAELQKLDLGVSKIRALDQNAIDLGQIGFNNFRLLIGGGSIPIQIRMSFYVSINPEGVPEFEIIEAFQNFNEVNLSLKKYELVIPAIEVLINGKTYPLNKGHLQKEFALKLPTILIQIRDFLHTFTTEKIPGLLNELAKKQLVKTVQEIKFIDAPGGSKNKDAPFQWGLQLKELTQYDNIRLSLDTFIEDAQNPDSEPEAPSEQNRTALLNTIPQDQFDLGIAIDLAMINRLLQLSFERKIFEKIPLDEPQTKPLRCAVEPVKQGRFLRLMRAPKVLPADYKALPQPGWGETYIKIRLMVQVPDDTITGLQKAFIKDNFIMRVDLILKLKKNETHGLTARLWSADYDSIQLNGRDLKWLGHKFKSVVENNIKSEFKKMSAAWQCNETNLAENIPIPNSIFGVQTELQHLITEPTGYLALYLNFKDKKGK